MKGKIIVKGDLIVTGCNNHNEFAELKKNGVTVACLFATIPPEEGDSIISYKNLLDMKDIDIFVSGAVYCHKY